MRVSDTHAVSAPVISVPAGELTVGEVANIINNLKEVPSLEEIREWFSKLNIRRRDYESYRMFTPRKYARNLIARSEYAELLLLCWRSGQRTPIHDHGGSVGMVM